MKITFPSSFQIQENVPLSEYTSLKVGGPAKYLAAIHEQEECVELYRYCRQRGIPFLSLGQGTNVFFADRGFPGLVALLKLDRITVGPKDRLIAESGAALSAVGKTCLAHSLTGLEFAAGIPGSVGGALFGNAGAYGKTLGDCLKAAKILTAEGETVWAPPDFFQFSYRHSALKKNPAIVLQAEFQFKKGRASEIEEKVAEILATRRRKLPPPEVPTAGCYFKNPVDARGHRTAAALYLEAVGSKHLQVGDAAVHPQHANFVYNKGQATAQDILGLEKELQARVRQRFGLQLEREVMYIG